MSRTYGHYLTTQAHNLIILQIKLEIQDVKDNIDFHFSHFEEALKNNFSAIKEGIDESYSVKYVSADSLFSRFQKASDSVIEKLENIKATISINYKELSESLVSNDKVAEINSRLKLAKEEVPKFVSSGMESFVDVFKRLKSEFTINFNVKANEQPASTAQPGDVKEQNTTAKSTSETATAENKTADASTSDQPKQDASKDGVKTENDNKEAASNTGTPAVSTENKESKSADETKPAETKKVEESKPAEESKPSKESKPSEESKPAEETKKVEESKPAEETKKVEESKPVEETKPGNESKPGSGSDKIDLESIPADAIIRTINSYFEDVDIEGKKLLSSILFNLK
ncbi:conserved hypothetical protein [Theileria orientalis strain Shintoku]|uniref:Uncharacterized protein n=1 Tax=Theileria orientalis strain Shintoku TaxID=869250 RepID=J4C7P0_THEOR|nr:conserved hypothetical protein [Theileria orientalis strain Shintoku]BAM39373.1 conserved hypothetical protein [Theileria orientalis strain Shintoku]|eukprot:XP_009689674.1 conserved hypothetical protein [Theileria orientalis strain Shintoku]